MKRFVSLLLLLVVLLCACAGTEESEGEVRIDKEQSWFSHFTVEGNRVTIKCKIFIENPTDDDVELILIGVFQDEYEAGLLKERQLVGVLEKCPEDVILTVPPGGTCFDVDFRGTYGGLFQKQNRLLPEIKLILL